MDSQHSADEVQSSESPSDTSESRHSGLSRRAYLGGLLALGAVGVYETSRSATANVAGVSVPTAYLDRFPNVVDVVEAGADPTGGQTIHEVLYDVVADDTLVVFPEGRYRMDHQFRHTGFENVGFFGPDATIFHGRIDALSGSSVSAGEFTGPARFFRLGVIYNPGRDLLFEGFTFDFNAPQTGLRAIEAYVAGGLEVRDVTIAGRHDTGTLGPALFSITQADGAGVVERFRAPGGAAFSKDTIGDLWTGPTGMLIDSHHAGTLRVVDSELGSFPDNGLYISGAHGTVHVEGGYYANSNVASIRLKGLGSSIRGATIVVDQAIEGTNQRGIRVDDGSNLLVDGATVRISDPNGAAIRVLDDVQTARIQNCSIVLDSATPERGIRVSKDAGRVEIVDTSVETRGGSNAIHVEGHNGPEDAMVLLRNVTITGDAAGISAREAIRIERANCRLDHLTVDQPGPEFRRCLEVIGDDCLINGGSYSSTHHPIINRGSRTFYDSIVARSYDGYEAMKLYAEGTEVVVDDSTLYGGYRDGGVNGLFVHETEFPPA
jgi:hypothetical protein